MKKWWFTALAAAVLAACSVPAARPVASPPIAPQPKPDSRLAEWRAGADALLAKGSYAAMKEAFALYGRIEAAGGGEEAWGGGYVRTALLLAARAAEMGIREPAYLAAASRLVEAGSESGRLEPFLRLVRLLPVHTAGIFDDGPAPDDPAPAVEALRKNEAAFAAAAETDEALACLWGALNAEFPTPEARTRILPGLLRLHPDSLAMKYRVAGVVDKGAPLWDEVLAADPDFTEALVARSGRALAERKLLAAEKSLLPAHERIPESPLISVQLAGIGFALEEYERSLGFYERTLAAAPAYKEAGLGKAVALICLGRPGEAAPLQEDHISRGPTLRGECYFWLATSRHAQGDLVRAGEAIEAAKPLLERSQVFTLSGTIQFDAGGLEAAEKDLLKAVAIDMGDREAHFLLGRIQAKRGAWQESGHNFRAAAYGYAREVLDLRDKAGEIEASDLAAERKSRLVARKKAQIEKAGLTRATAFYNAAAGFHNAGDMDMARNMAGQAVGHPVFAAKARDFLIFLDGLR